MESKECCRCNQTLSLDQFYDKSGGKLGKSPYCRTCSNLQTLERQRDFKKQCIDYKGGKCSKCGYNKCMSALEFHHLNPLEKDFTISYVKHQRFDIVKEELDKTILVCANCHRETHYEQSLKGSFKALAKPKKKKDIEKYPKANGRKNHRKPKELIEELVSKKTLKEASLELNISEGTLSKWCKFYSIKIIKKKPKEESITKINWPSKEELEKLVWRIPTHQLSKLLGVSDNAVGDRCKKYGINKPPRGYWEKQYHKSINTPTRI